MTLKQRCRKDRNFVGSDSHNQSAPQAKKIDFGTGVLYHGGVGGSSPDPKDLRFGNRFF